MKASVKSSIRNMTQRLRNNRNPVEASASFSLRTHRLDSSQATPPAAVPSSAHVEMSPRQDQTTAPPHPSHQQLGEEPPKSKLLSLPPEVRLHILDYCLDGGMCSTEKWTLDPDRVSDAQFKQSMNTVISSSFPVAGNTDHWMPVIRGRTAWSKEYHFSPQVLRACRQMYHEGKSILYDRNDWIAIMGVPIACAGEFMHLGRWACRCLTAVHYAEAFPVGRHGNQSNREPAMTVTIMGLPGPLGICMVLLEDVWTAFSSIQHCIMRQNPPPTMTGLNRGPLISVMVHRVRLPGVEIYDAAQVVAKMNDTLFPWLGRWMSHLEIDGNRIPIVKYHDNGISVLPSFQTLDYGHLALWQWLTLLRRLERLTHQIEEVGLRRVSFQSLAFLVQQALDTMRGMAGHLMLRPRNGQDPLHRLIATAAWLLAGFEIDTLPNLSRHERIAMKRSQIFLACVAARFGGRSPVPVKWEVQALLRLAILAHEMEDYPLANSALHAAVRTKISLAQTLSVQELEERVEEHIKHCLSKASLPESVGTKGYVRRGLKPSDFPLLVEAWSKYSGFDDAVPVLTETEEAHNVQRMWEALAVQWDVTIKVLH